MRIPDLQRAFTLIELLVTISIISMLASIVVASVSSARHKAQGAAKFQQLDQLRKALELYYADHDSYPDTGFDPYNWSVTWMNVRIIDQCDDSFLTRFGKSSSDTPIIPGLVPKYISQFPSDRPSAVAECHAYFYISNGKDYKYLEHNTNPESLPPGNMLLDPYYLDSYTYTPASENGVIMSIRSDGANHDGPYPNWNIGFEP